MGTLLRHVAVRGNLAAPAGEQEGGGEGGRGRRRGILRGTGKPLLIQVPPPDAATHGARTKHASTATLSFFLSPRSLAHTHSLLSLNQEKEKEEMTLRDDHTKTTNMEKRNGRGRQNTGKREMNHQRQRNRPESRAESRSERRALENIIRTISH